MKGLEGGREERLCNQLQSIYTDLSVATLTTLDSMQVTGLKCCEHNTMSTHIMDSNTFSLKNVDRFNEHRCDFVKEVHSYWN